MGGGSDSGLALEAAAEAAAAHSELAHMAAQSADVAGQVAAQAALAKITAPSSNAAPPAASVAVERHAEVDLEVAAVFDAREQLAAQVQEPTWNPPAWLSQIHDAAAEITAAIARSIEAVVPMLGAWRHATQRTEQIEAAGWLAHYTTPWAEIDAVLDDPAQVSSVLERHYSDNWRAVRREFTNRLRFYDVDDEAKSLFREALSTHRRGHYRSCIRALFPEIERLVRLELPPVTRRGPDQALMAAAEELDVTQTEPGGWYAAQLFEKLETQLYAQVRTDDEVAAAAAFSVPARHGATHGRVVYSSMRHSINALIMADYVFQVISAIKRNRKLLSEAKGGRAAA